MKLDKTLEKLSPISTILLVWVGALGLVAVSTPQYPIDFSNKYVYGPIVAFAISAWYDLR